MSLAKNPLLHTGSAKEPVILDAPQKRSIKLVEGKPRFGDPLINLYGLIRPMLDKGHTILHFVGAVPHEGTSTVARDFALTAGMRGHKRTLLIDGNMHNPTTGRQFNCPRDRGILDDMREHRPWEQGLIPVSDKGFSVGCLQGTDVRGHVRGDEVRAAYAVFKTQYDLTVIDCASIDSANYADLLPEAADGVIMVIQAESTRPLVVARARDVIEQLGGTVLGAVLNRRKDYIPDAIYRYL